MKRNQLEINGFKFSKIEAIKEAERIISARKEKINKARQPYHNAVKEFHNLNKELKKLNTNLNFLNNDIINEESIKNRLYLTKDISLLEENIMIQKGIIETLRLQKNKDMKKCCPAWKLQDVEYIGKRGGNHLLMSK